MESIRPPVPAPNSCCQPGTNDKASSRCIAPQLCTCKSLFVLVSTFVYLKVPLCTCKYLFVLASTFVYLQLHISTHPPAVSHLNRVCGSTHACVLSFNVVSAPMHCNVHIAGPEPTSRHPLIMAPLHCCVGYYYAGTEPSAINPMFDATHGTTLALITNHGIICTCQSQPCKTDTSYFETGNLITLVPLWLIWQGSVTGAKK